MMNVNKKLAVTLLSAPLLLMAVETVPVTPRLVTFRFDDNQNVEVWQKLAELFRKHHARYSCSLNPKPDLQPDSPWTNCVRSLQQEGFEIMDHTPLHQTVSWTFASPEELAKYANAPFADHVTGKTLYFKTDPGMTELGGKFAAAVSGGNKIVSLAPKVKLVPYRLYKDLKSGKFYFYVVRKNSGFLTSVWGENNVRLADDPAAAFAECRRVAFLPAPGTVEFLAERSQEAFKRLNLALPVCWIQPGGTIPAWEAAGLAKVLPKYGYVSAATYPWSSVKGFCDGNFDRNAFAMQWSDFRLDSGDTFAKQKTDIADKIACHRACIGSSHVIAYHKRKFPELLKNIDELLSWMEANHIEVVTQSEMTRRLAGFKPAPGSNIFPSLSCDLDGNGRPDGCIPGPKTTVQDGVLSLVTGERALYIPNLCALPQKDAVFSCELAGKCSVEITLCWKNAYGKGMHYRRFVLQNNAPGWKKFSKPLPPVPKSTSLGITFKVLSSDQGKLRAPELKPSSK